jgi:hypothetical protein
MPFSSHTDRLTDADRQRLDAIHAQRRRFRPSPLIPFLVALAGIACAIAAFFVWPTSLEGAATLLLAGVTMLAAGGMVALGRYQTIASARAFEIPHHIAIQRAEVCVVSLASTRVIPLPDFDEDFSAALFEIEDGHVLVREDVLSFFPGWDDNKLPASFTARLLTDHTVLSVTRGEADCPLAPELSEDQKTQLFLYVDAKPERTGPFCFIPADSLKS